MNKGLMDLMIVCRDSATIHEKKDMLRSWLSDPEKILQYARDANSGLPLSDYLDDLWKSLSQKFRKSSLEHRYRSLEREHVILRVVIHSNLIQMDAVKNTCSHSKRALVGLRKLDSLVETEIASNKKQKCEETGLPENIIEILAAAPSFLTTSPHVDFDVVGPDDNIAGDKMVGAFVHDNRMLEPVVDGCAIKDSTTGMKDASFDTPYDSLKRWLSLRVATPAEMRSVEARLKIEAPDYDIHLKHAPVELYVAWGLDSLYHIFEVLPQGSCTGKILRPTLQVPDVGPLHTCKPHIAVARPGCSIYDESFPPLFFHIDLKKLVNFIFTHGTTDASRSIPTTLDLPPVGSRVDFGNAGQAMEADVDEFRPMTLCGTGIFDKCDNGILIRAMLGRILDSMAKAVKRILEAQGRLGVHNLRRYTEFAEHLKKLLFATSTTNEWVSLQLLNLSHHQGGVRHKDKYSDGRQGYDHTSCKCIHFIDALENLWSLKIIAGFRKRIGDYMSGSLSKIMSLKSRIQSHIYQIDSKYTALMGLYLGAHIPAVSPSWKDTSHFWLDDGMPFEKYDLGHGITQEYFLIVTGSQRSFWLSACLSGIYKLSPYLTERGMVQLAVMAAWQNSFHYYHEVCERLFVGLEEENSTFAVNRDYPIFSYHDVCIRLFGRKKGGTEIIGGPHPRYSPMGKDFEKLFGRDEDKMDRFVDVLLRLMDAINERAAAGGDMAREWFGPVLKASNEAINEIAVCDLNEFRLQVFLQVCFHLRVRLNAGKHLRTLLYPVPKAASHDSVIEFGFKHDQVDDVCSMLRTELSTPDRDVEVDEIETSLCEGQVKRLLTKFDVFIKGQSLIWIDKHGVSWVKRYGEYVWKKTRKLFKK
jgi:hypothetical protein